MDRAFQVSQLPGDVGLVTFDVPGKKVNTFSQTILAELDQLISDLAKQTGWQGLLFRSGKPGQFIAGADLREIAALAKGTPDDVRRFLELGHRLFQQLSDLPYPTVALIDGPCLGGGTELILSLDYRLAADAPASRIGLPETMLGMIPGWGGTQRLPRIIGWRAALEMICSGKPVSAGQAAACGLVSETVPSEQLIEVGCGLIARVQQTGEWKRLRESRRQPVALDTTELNSFTAALQQELDKSPGPRSVAKHKAVEAVRAGLSRPLHQGLEIERELAATVIGSPAAAALIEDFFQKRSAPPTRPG